MRRNPIYVFKDQTTLGINDIPLESMIQIIDSDGVGTPLFIQLTNKTGLSASSTIADFLAISSAYVNLDKDTLSELEKVGNGWRLLGKNPAMYSTPGTNAVDLSTSEVAGNYGAGGTASFAVGTGTRAQNPNSVGMGAYNIGASANTILEIGAGTYATPMNILEVLKEGTVVTPNTSTAEIDNAGSKTLTTVEYVQDRIASEFPSKTTDNLAEGSNLYYTNTRDTANFNTNIAMQNINVLVDVDTTTNAPTSGQVLKWDGGTWVPGDDLHEVTSVNTQVGNVVLDTDDVAEGANNNYYTEAKFNNSFNGKTTDDLLEGAKKFYTSAAAQADADVRIKASPLATLSDVNDVVAGSGQVLMSNGSKWNPGTINVGVTKVNSQTGVVSLNLGNLVDVDVAGAGDGYVLSWDNANSKWIAAPDTDTTYGLANTTVDGLMSKVDFNKLAGIADAAEVNAVAVDVGDSTAADVPVLVADFNALLASLRTAGIIA